MKRKILVWITLLALCAAMIPAALAEDAAQEEIPVTYAILPVPASTVVDGMVAELAEGGIKLALVSAEQYQSNSGNMNYQYIYNAEPEISITLYSYDGETVKKICMVTKTLDTGEEWTALCRQIPETKALGLPDGIRAALADIEVNNGGMSRNAQADGWTISVGGVMDVRSVWDLMKDDAFD